MPWSPLAGGFLSGKYRKGNEPPAGTRLERWKERYTAFDLERNWRTLAAVEALAKELGTTSAAVSLAWLLRRPCVSSVIFGARTVAQLDENLAALDVRLSDPMMKILDEASRFELGYPYDFIARVQSRW